MSEGTAGTAAGGTGAGSAAAAAAGAEEALRARLAKFEAKNQKLKSALVRLRAGNNGTRVL